MNIPCRCTTPHPIGSTHVIGSWSPLPEAAPREPVKSPLTHELLNCACGCQEYVPGAQGISQGFSEPDIPVLPLVVEYEDDDGPSDDHEYVSIKATEFADMVSALRSCTCQDH